MHDERAASPGHFQSELLHLLHRVARYGRLSLLKGEGEGESFSGNLVPAELEPLTSILSPCEGERQSALSKLPRNSECFRHKLLSL